MVWGDLEEGRSRTLRCSWGWCGGPVDEVRYRDPEVAVDRHDLPLEHRAVGSCTAHRKLVDVHSGPTCFVTEGAGINTKAPSERRRNFKGAELARGWRVTAVPRIAADQLQVRVVPEGNSCIAGAQSLMGTAQFGGQARSRLKPKDEVVQVRICDRNVVE